MDPAAPATLDNVSNHIDSTGIVVKVNPPRKVRCDEFSIMKVHSVNIVDPIVMYHRAARRDPITAAGINGARVFGLKRQIMKMIKLYDI